MTFSRFPKLRFQPKCVSCENNNEPPPNLQYAYIGAKELLGGAFEEGVVGLAPVHNVPVVN